MSRRVPKHDRHSSMDGPYDVEPIALSTLVGWLLIGIGVSLFVYAVLLVTGVVQ